MDDYKVLEIETESTWKIGKYNMIGFIKMLSLSLITIMTKSVGIILQNAEVFVIIKKTVNT